MELFHGRLRPPAALSRVRSLRRAALLVAVVAVPVASADASIGGFEQVTPVNKAGGNVSAADTFRASEDGSGLLYTASAPFAGAPVDSSPLYVRYVGRKVGSSWATTAVDPPFDVIAPSYNNYIMGTVGSSVDLAYVLVTSSRALAPGATAGGSNIYLRNTATGAFTLVATSSDIIPTRDLTSPSGATSVVYVSPDGDGVMFTSRTALTPDAPDGVTVLYGWTPKEGLYVLSRLPIDQGGGAVGGGTSGISENGLRRTLATRDALDRVYFQSSGLGVYVREGTNSLAVSRSEVSGNVEDARILASSEDGEYALIETVGDAPLTNDTPVDPSFEFPTYWYRYTRSSGDLAYVGTNNPNGFPSGKALQMSRDGRTIVFQSGFPQAAGAEAGALNMYVWRDGELRLVSLAQEPTSVTSGGVFLRLLSRNGRYLAFSDNDPATFARAGVDSGLNPCPTAMFGFGRCDEVFVYDTESGDLTCASCRPAGVAQRGSSGDPGTGDLGFIRMDQHQPQNVSDDGTVWFTSDNDLLPSVDANGLRDVYASRNGELRLVSRGRQGMSSRFLDATPDGSVVFISTNDPISRSDDDAEVDIYATGSGVAVPSNGGGDPQNMDCGGSDCRIPPGSPPAPEQAPTTSLGTRGSEVAGPKSIRAKVKTARVRRAKNRLEIVVQVSGDGRIRVSGKGLHSAARTVNRAGTYVLRARLSRSSRAAIRRNGRVGLRLRTSFSPPFSRSAVSTVRKVVR